MALTLREIRDNTSAARKLMKRARKEGFAVGAFSLDNQEALKAVVRAALAKKAPVLVEISPKEADSIGLENIRDMVDNYKREFGIEIYLSLSYCPTVEDAINGIETGFEFIHIDISAADNSASGEEIIKKTRMVVNYANLTGALVESEPHVFRGDVHTGYAEIKKTFSTPEAAKKFVDNTGIDIYAAAIGNLHAEYPLPRVLDLKLLNQIRDTVGCHLSLHGGSGTPDHYFKDAVAGGVSKISVDSDMRRAFRNSLDRVLKENPDELAVAKLMDEVIGAVQKVSEEKIDLFGSTGKAS